MRQNWVSVVRLGRHDNHLYMSTPTKDNILLGGHCQVEFFSVSDLKIFRQKNCHRRYNDRSHRYSTPRAIGRVCVFVHEQKKNYFDIE